MSLHFYSSGCHPPESSALIGLRWRPNSGVGSELAQVIARVRTTTKNSPRPTALAGASWLHKLEALQDQALQPLTGKEQA